MTWISGIPDVMRAGTTITWEDDSATVGFDQTATSADWTLTYYLRSAVSGAHTAIGSAHNNGWRFTISASDSESFNEGDWSFQAVVSKGSEKFPLGEGGTFKVKQSFAYTGTTPGVIDTRSDNKKARDNIEAALRKFADGMQEYSIGGRSYKRSNISDLHVELYRLNAEILKEDDAEKISQGLGSGRRFFVRF